METVKGEKLANKATDRIEQKSITIHNTEAHHDLHNQTRAKYSGEEIRNHVCHRESGFVRVPWCRWKIRMTCDSRREHALNVFGFIFSAIWNIFSVAWCCDLNETRSNEINWQPKSYESIIESRQWTEIHRARITTNRSWDNFRWGDETNKSHKSINHTFVVRWRWAERKTKTENISSQSLLVVFVMRLCITRHDEPDSAGFLSAENSRELHAAHSGDFSSQSLAQQAEQIFFCFQMIFSLSVREQKNESRGYK